MFSFWQEVQNVLVHHIWLRHSSIHDNVTPCSLSLVLHNTILSTYVQQFHKKSNTFQRSFFKTILNSNIIIIKSSSSISSSSIYGYQLKLHHQNKPPCGSVATKTKSIKN